MLKARRNAREQGYTRAAGRCVVSYNDSFPLFGSSQDFRRVAAVSFTAVLMATMRRDFLYRLSEWTGEHTQHNERQGERVLTQRAGGCVPSRNKDVDGNERESRAGAEPDECPRQY